MNITSRSRVQAFLDCPRKGWWLYEAPSNGLVKGWERHALNLFYATGIATHKGVENRLKGIDAKPAYDEAVAWYMEECARRGLDVEVPEDQLYTVREQAALVEAMLWGWERVRLPRILEEWEILEVEVEEVTPLSDDLTLAGRADVVARRRMDGRVFVWNFKTTGQPGARWYEGFEYDAQLLTEALAVERRMGEQVAGVVIEGFVKGQRVAIDADGHEVRGDEQASQRPIVRYIQRSPLIYGWKVDANPPLSQAVYDYQSSRKAGWHRFPVWDDPQWDVERWVNWLPAEVVEQQFVSVPPIMGGQGRTDSLVKQIIGIENRAKHRINQVARVVSDADELDLLFPQNFSKCLWPTKCQCFDLCHTPGVAENPAGSGIYQPRTANHPIELGTPEK